MPPKKKKSITPEERDKFIAELLRDQAQRQQNYRDRALSLFPHICSRCGREFNSKTIRELTVHHKDHNASNNPPDGSNWELLCRDCHDGEHQDVRKPNQYADLMAKPEDEPPLTFNAFEALLKPKPEKPGPKRE